MDGRTWDGVTDGCLDACDVMKECMNGAVSGWPMPLLFVLSRLL